MKLVRRYHNQFLFIKRHKRILMRKNEWKRSSLSFLFFQWIAYSMSFVLCTMTLYTVSKWKKIPIFNNFMRKKITKNFLEIENVAVKVIVTKVWPIPLFFDHSAKWGPKLNNFLKALDDSRRTIANSKDSLIMIECWCVKYIFNCAKIA